MALMDCESVPGVGPGETEHCPLLARVEEMARVVD
jgi:hypothetical protein